MLLRERTWKILDVAKPGDKMSRAFDIFILSLIMSNVAAVVLGTVVSVEAQWGEALLLFEVFSASGIYYCEYEAQPEHFSSIPKSFWWAVVTLTTVGYGDAYPITVAGKLFASLVAILGIGMFALPTGILGAGFVEEIRRKRELKEKRKCPHCGRDIE